MPESPVRFRRATAADSRRIWAWRNEPSVRAVSFSNDEIPFDVHDQWYARRVDDPDTVLLIAIAGDGPDSTEIGYVRFDRHGPAAEINVCLDPAFRDRRLGRVVIRQSSVHVLRETRAERIVALVRPGNAASLAAFARAGFVPQGPSPRPGVDAIELHFTAQSVLFRVDAGPSIGIGHLQRCLSVAAALSASGCEIAFVVNDAPAAAERVAAAGWPVATLAGRASWSDDDAERVVEEIAARRATVVVVDSDLESPHYMRRIKAAGVCLCSVEDNGNDEVVADVLVNGDAHAGVQPYRSVSGDTQFLLGPAYAPLAAEYRDGAAEAAVPPRTVLFSLGGSDSHGLMPALIHAARALPALNIHVVIGPFTGRLAEIDAALAGLTGPVTVHRSPASMWPIISACDVAVSAAGQTLYELAACARPAIAIEVADNQHLQLQAFVQSGAVLSAGAAGDAGIADRAMALARRLLAEPSELRAMAAAGRRLIDGRGAERVADALLERALRFTVAGPEPVIPSLLIRDE